MSEDNDLVAYVGAGLTESRVPTSPVCLSISTANQTSSYLLDTPLPWVLTELVALRDGLSTVLPLIANLLPYRVHF